MDLVLVDLPHPHRVVLRMFAAMNAGDADGAAVCVSEDMQMFLPATVPFDNDRGGRAGFRAFVADLLAAFGDLHIEVEAAMLLQDAFVVTLVSSATGADGRPRTWRAEVLFGIRDGLVNKQVVRVDNGQLLADTTAVGPRAIAA